MIKHSNEYKKSLFIAALRNNFWRVGYDEEEGIPYAEYCYHGGHYHIKLYRDKFIVYKKEGETLIPLKDYPYSQRQSQLLKRLMIRFR